MATELIRIPAYTEPLPIPAVALAVLQRTSNAEFAAEEFFRATISNEHTRRAYGRIVGRFLAWCNSRKLEVSNITPGKAGDYFGQLKGSEPTKNQALAALRKFFDVLVQRHAIALNPFASVSGIKYQVSEGKTAELSIEQAKNSCTRSIPAMSLVFVIGPCSACSHIRVHASGLWRSCVCPTIGTTANIGCCGSRKRAAGPEKFRCGMISRLGSTNTCWPPASRRIPGARLPSSERPMGSARS
jgi:Phage integrase, N-terminal SAM-like domain